MRSYLMIGALGVLVACSGAKQSKVKYGVTTAAQLRAAMGEPLSQQATSAQHPSEVVIYPEDERYQIEQNIVVAGFRNPTEQERTLLYWRHHFQGKETTFSATPSAAPSHVHKEMQLRCPSEGLTIIYDTNLDVVTRVVEHAQQGN